MKTFKESLATLGFKAMSRKVFACRAGELLHSVVIGKDRHGSDVVSVLVSIPGFFEHDAAVTLDTIQSPLAGDVSPRGVVSSWAWDKGTLDSAHVAKLIEAFFSGFATPGDVRSALAGWYVPPHYEALLPLDLPVPDSVKALPAACYQTPGGAVSREEARALACTHLEKVLAPLGFALADTADIVAVRRRGTMFDAVRVMMDEFGTFLTLICFPWSEAIPVADKNWEDRYYPMLPFCLSQDGKPYVMTRQAFLDMAPEQLRSLLEDDIRRSGQVSNHLEFAAALDASFADMAARLRGLPV
jgi:hypothetical protein